MNAMQCGVCGAPTRDLWLCPGDIRALADLLTAAPGLISDLQVTMARQDAIGSSDEPRRGSTTPLPLNPDAMQALGQLRAACRRIIQHQGLLRHPQVWATTTAGWADAGDIFAELDRAIGRARRVIDRRASRWYYGDCEMCAAMGHVTQLYAPPDATRIECPRGDHSFDATILKGRQWQAADSMLVARPEAWQWIAIRYEVDPEKVRKAIDLWVHRGRLEDHAGRVRFGDVDQLWRKRIAMRRRKADLAGAA